MAIPGFFIEIISDTLHNLEELFISEINDEDFDSIECLVTGCPKLKVLHLNHCAPAETARCLLLGLPNLTEFQHPAMVLALEQIIKDGQTERVSALRNLYVYTGDELDCEFDRVVKSAQMVMKHLGNITKLDITENSMACNENLTGLYKLVSKLTFVTDMTIEYYSKDIHDIVNTLKAVRHQLRLLDLCCPTASPCNELCSISDAVNQCRELRVLRLNLKHHAMIDLLSLHQDYGNDLMEEFTPFCYLHKLHLEGMLQSDFKSALCKSLIASPLLQNLRLVSMPNLTDHVIRAAFNHINDEGEQLAFRSLRTLSLSCCNYVTNYLESVVTDEKVPLESLDVTNCCNVTDMHLWDLGRFEMNVW